MPESPLELSIVIPARNEVGSIAGAVSGAQAVCDEMGLRYEILVVDAGSADGTGEAAEKAGARVIQQRDPGYGGAIIEGVRAARAEWVLTMDADLSHPPQFLERLWANREGQDLIVASRYVPGGYAEMPLFRLLLSKILNLLFATVLSLPVRDLSSGFRLYRRESLLSIPLEGTDFNVLQHIIVHMYNNGFWIKEVPFYYQPRKAGASNARIFRFGLSYIRTLYKLWKVRNDLSSADYDFRAFYSRHPLQRFWQQKRFRILTGYIDSVERALDVGSGSSVFAAQYPNITALDVSPAKLRFLRRFNPNVVQAHAAQMPFGDATFKTVICSTLIEHNRENNILTECVRVLRPGGVLIIGTPDYGSQLWPFIEAIYKAIRPEEMDKDAHINHYTRARLLEEIRNLGLKVVEEKYILGSEIILKAVKPASE